MAGSFGLSNRLGDNGRGDYMAGTVDNWVNGAVGQGGVVGQGEAASCNTIFASYIFEINKVNY